jgi:hypothetical protein|nr:MAG TPA: hypothetical protein [Caudoviricetes sp.]
MADYYHYVMWYTVYDAKNGNLLASGTSDMCARRLGYKSANSFASSVYHCRKKKRKPHKYSFFQEVIKRDEVDSLPPPATRGRAKASKNPPVLPVPAGREKRLMVEPHHHKNTTICGKPQGGKT